MKVVLLAKMCVIQVVVACEVVPILQSHFYAKLCAGGGLKLALGCLYKTNVLTISTHCDNLAV